MNQPWNSISRIINNEDIVIERIRIKRTNIGIEGEFEPPPLMHLTEEDQIFVAAFIRCHDQKPSQSDRRTVQLHRNRSARREGGCPGQAGERRNYRGRG